MELQHRSATLTRAAADSDTFELSFSSEAPVERYGGTETLSHERGAVDLSRLAAGAPLLWGHDPDKVIGRVIKAAIVNKRGIAICRWGTSALAKEIRADVDAGVIHNVSVGYSIDKTESAGAGSYRVTRWEPIELSLVSIPADPSVGVNRSFSTSSTRPTMTRTTPATEAQADNGAALATIAEAIGRLTEKVEAVERRSMQPAAPQQRIQPIAGASDYGYGSDRLDMSRQEEQRYSLVKAIRAAATGDWRDAGFERECSHAMEQQTGRQARGFFVPTGNLKLDTRAAYAVGTASLGGNLVETTLQEGSFIEALRNQAVVADMGATMLPGLVGNAPIPRRSGVSSTYWVAEGGAVTNSNGTVDQVSLTPKTLGALSNFTRLAQLQTTPEIEQLIRVDFAAVIALGIDLAALRGTGASNQPLGITGTAGIGSVAGGTNGLTISYDHLAQLKAEVAIDNADIATSGFIINAKTEAKLMQLKDADGNYLLGPAAIASGSPGGFWGRRYMVSNQLPSTLTKGSSSGVCSQVMYGNFADLVIGMWGGLDVLVNPYGSGYAAGDVEIRAMQTCDIGVRHPESFATMLDALTV